MIHALPKFTHDCGACTFLGGKVVDGTHYDFYVCKGEYIAREGNEGSNYRSIPSEYVNLHPILKNAQALHSLGGIHAILNA